MNTPVPTAYIDEHGYPTPAALEKIQSWPTDSERWQHDLLAFVQSLWWPEPGVGWRRTPAARGATEVLVASNGWKGNEDLIAALQMHRVFWSLCWEWSRRGGAYLFVVR